MAIKVVILTEDTGKDNTAPLEALIKKMFRYVDRDFRDSQVCFEPYKHGVLGANAWKNPRRKTEVNEVARYIATQTQDPDVFVCAHVDADCRWSDVFLESGAVNTKGSENFDLFEALFVCKVVETLMSPPRGQRNLSYASAHRAVQDKFFRIIPFYSIESWLFQNLGEVQNIILEKPYAISTDDSALLAAWEDPTALDEHLKPKDTFCLGAKYNARLSEREYPAQKVYEAQRSLWWCVKQMEGSWALHRALAREKRRCTGV